MDWYLLTGLHIKDYNNTLKYFNTPEFQESANVIDEFYRIYIRPYREKSGLIPKDNPLIYHEFLLHKNPKDLYISLGKLSRHFITSPRLFELWKEYNLDGNVWFEGVVLKNKEETRKDYLYCHFYHNMGDNIDYKKSLFLIKERGNNEIISHIRISNESEFKDKESKHTRSSGTTLAIAELCIPGILDVDLFFLMNISETKAFISERLYKIMIREKMTGADMHKFNQFKITG
jgi:hypothetical protein